MGTIDEKGNANIHPVWFLFENNSFYILTPKSSRKAKNIFRRNLVYFSIDDETLPYKGVKGKASVIKIEDEKQRLAIATKIITKYLASTENDIGRFILNNIESGEQLVLKLDPKFYSTWAF